MSSLTKDIQILLKFENDMFFLELKRDTLYKLSHENTSICFYSDYWLNC